MKKLLTLCLLLAACIPAQTACEAYYWVSYCNMADEHTVIVVLSLGPAPPTFKDQEKDVLPCYGHILKIVNVKISTARFKELEGHFPEIKHKGKGGKGPCE